MIEPLLPPMPDTDPDWVFTDSRRMKNAFWIKLSEIKLAVADLTDYYGVGHIINRINVPKTHRGQGHARELLRQVTEEADAKGEVLYLEVSQSDGLNNDQLRAWYGRHGFLDYHGMMRRKPETKEQK